MSIKYSLCSLLGTMDNSAFKMNVDLNVTVSLRFQMPRSIKFTLGSPVNLAADADCQFNKEEIVMGIFGYSTTLGVSGGFFKKIYLFICMYEGMCTPLHVCR